MARTASIAIGGYYPTPDPMVTRILGLLVPPDPFAKSYASRRVVIDPCAGEGEALRRILRTYTEATGFTCEMEESRAHTCRSVAGYQNALHGDFFLVDAKQGCASLLWLNPPYDHDREFKRLEERFLQRAAPLLCQDGILIFIVPGYALAASAVTLARLFSDMKCWRFSDGEFEVFSQVVLVGRYSPKPTVDAAAEAQVRAWAQAAADLPVLPETADPQFHVPTVSSNLTWEMGMVDLHAIQEQFHPWMSDRGEITDLNPPADLESRYNRVFPVASTPRATHLAAALAAGVFNGARVEPDDADSTLPPLLVKGVFNKEFRTVEEKHNKQGEKISEVQVQHPVLQVTVLDLNAGTFHMVRPSAELPFLSSVEGMTLANLFDIYGGSLMRAMRQACPVLHDPQRDPEIEITSIARPLFAAQKSVVNTALRMVREQDRQAMVVLGEIGSGKTGVALAIAAEQQAKRVLVMCPPHLLDSWRNETRAVLPNYDVMVLDSITDAEAFSETVRPTIGVLSRERAKLGHGWRGVSGRCPKCGSALGETDFSVKRERCEHRTLTPKNAAARWLVKHINEIARLLPSHSIVEMLLGHTQFGQTRIQAARAKEPSEWSIPVGLVETALPLTTRARDAALWLAWAAPTLATQVAAALDDPAWDADAFTRQILMATPPGTEITHQPPKQAYGYGYGHIHTQALADFDKHYRFVHGLEGGEKVYSYQDFGKGTLKSVAWGSLEAFRRLVDTLTSMAQFSGLGCGEPLFYAVAEPRRYPIATWISKYARNCYDVLVVDEAHEFSSEDSAQSHAKARLELNTKAMLILLTGSFSNGYADSVYNNMYAVSPEFRGQFGREGRTRFVDRYGYWKQVVQEKDAQGKVIAFGSQSDRVQRTARRAGMAPGILPLFNLEWLLPNAVTLQKEDLHLDLPKPEHSTCGLPMLNEQATNYRHLLTTLIEEIRKSRWEEGRGGKLWGALAHLPGYLDLACCGDYSIRWPENVPEVGGQEIVKVPGMDPALTLPKEEWMLSTIEAELDAGRPVLVLAWHRQVLSRLLTVLQRSGLSDAIYLDATDVPTSKRQAWINKWVVKADRRVMVCNPVTIQTGLNNLVHFKTQLWMENPGCNPHIYRQAQGRIDRIGQTTTPRFMFPLYDESMQEQTHKLLLHKVGVALGVDGLDPEAALRAAGVEDGEFQGLSVGRALYRLLTGE